MKKITLLFISIISLITLHTHTAFAQKEKAHTPQYNLPAMQQHEAQLTELLKQFAAATRDTERISTCYRIIPKLVDALKEPHSFDYPFDSLKGISRLKSPDNKFRIFTIAIELQDTVTVKDKNKTLRFPKQSYKYVGAIQMNTPELTLFPLNDKSTEIAAPEDRELNPDNWWGALYYNVIENTYNNTTYYTLFGWDGNTEKSTKKVMEILHFTPTENKPIFGAPIIEVSRDGKLFPEKYRYILEFQDDAIVALNYVAHENKIIYDFVRPDDPKAKGKYSSYIPDGTYEGFQFINGQWKHTGQIANTVMQQAPRPNATLNTQRPGTPKATEPTKTDKKKKKKKRK